MALWREALLAQAVLRGETRGYKAHLSWNGFARIPVHGRLSASGRVATWERRIERRRFGASA